MNYTLNITLLTRKQERLLWILFCGPIILYTLAKKDLTHYSHYSLAKSSGEVSMSLVLYIITFFSFSMYLYFFKNTCAYFSSFLRTKSICATAK